GRNTNPVTYEWAYYTKRAKERELTACIFGWSGYNGDPDNFLSPLLGSSNRGNSNMARFNNSEIDALLNEAIGLTNKEER
ncbi:ABC transporter substrate-binding protein, partial [Haemophilus influenzae]|nr:ABC transporter substrate-binding protein [Haemophilus influenzae]